MLESRILRYLLPAVVALAVIAICFLLFDKRTVLMFASEKAYELTTQFFFVAVLGGAVGFAYRLWESEQSERKRNLDRVRDQKQAQRTSLHDFYKDVVDLHHNTKRVRRLMRASSFVKDDRTFMEKESFDLYMRELETYQLQAEGLKRSVDIRKALFHPRQSELFSSLINVESYLRDLLRQFENGFEDRFAVMEKDLIELNYPLPNFIRGDRSIKQSAVVLFDHSDKVRKLLSEVIGDKPIVH